MSTWCNKCQTAHPEASGGCHECRLTRVEREVGKSDHLDDLPTRLASLEGAVFTLEEQMAVVRTQLAFSAGRLTAETVLKPASGTEPLAAAIEADMAAVREAREEMFAALGAYYAAVGKARWEHTVDDMATSLRRYRDLVRGES